jgi:hypothetical protein
VNILSAVLFAGGLVILLPFVSSFHVGNSQLVNIAHAQDRPASEEDRLKDECARLVREWGDCQKSKGESDPECEKIFRELMQKIEELKELLKNKYSSHCKGEKATSAYCRNLAERIAGILEWIYLQVCFGEMADSQYCQDLKKEIEDWKRKAKLKKGEEKSARGASSGFQGDYGGVHIDPTPEKAGRGGSELRDKALKSRPSGDSLSWPVGPNK